MPSGNYNIPKVGTGTEEDPYRPKYVGDGEMPGVEKWGVTEDGDPMKIDVEGTQDALDELVAKPDVTEN